MGKKAYFWIRSKFVATDALIRFLFNPRVPRKAATLIAYLKLRVLARLQPRRRKVKALGFTVYVASLDLFRGIFRELFYARLYAFETAKRPLRIIDAGANIGDTLLYYKFTAPDAEVVCFEPDPVNVELIEANIAANKLENVTVHHAALADKPGTVTMYANVRSKGDTAQSISKNFRESLADEKDIASYQVEAVPLADYLDQPVDILKMDIEGAELLVLEAARDKLNNVGCLQLEFHYEHETNQLHPLLQLLEESGFDYRIQVEHQLTNVDGSTAMIYATRRGQDPAEAVVPTPPL